MTSLISKLGYKVFDKEVDHGLRKAWMKSTSPPNDTVDAHGNTVFDEGVPMDQLAPQVQSALAAGGIETKPNKGYGDIKLHPVDPGKSGDFYVSFSHDQGAPIFVGVHAGRQANLSRMGIDTVDGDYW